MNDDKFMKRLIRPTGRIDVVLDTDTYNEIDDQYAIAYLLKSSDKLNALAIYAAPFSNNKNSSSPKEGMEKSYNEIFNILKLMKREDMYSSVYRGSKSYLSDEKTPVISDAAQNLITRAMEHSCDNPLYVVSIGAITNIASALLLKPEIAQNIVVIWLGGHSYEWVDTREFNLSNDIAAARVVFNLKVPLVQLPCMGVVSNFRTTRPEFEYWLRDKNELCNYLINITEKDAQLDKMGDFWSRPIWDVTAVAWLLDENFMRDRYEHSPIVNYEGLYSFDKTRHFIKYVYYIDRDKLIEDLFTKLAK